MWWRSLPVKHGRQGVPLLFKSHIVKDMRLGESQSTLSNSLADRLDADVAVCFVWKKHEQCRIFPGAV